MEKLQDLGKGAAVSELLRDMGERLKGKRSYKLMSLTFLQVVFKIFLLMHVMVCM